MGGHNTIEIVKKHTVGAHFGHATLSDELQPGMLGVFFNVLNVSQNGLGLVQQAFSPMNNEADMHVLNGCEIGTGGVYQEQGRCATHIL